TVTRALWSGALESTATTWPTIVPVPPPPPACAGDTVALHTSSTNDNALLVQDLIAFLSLSDRSELLTWLPPHVRRIIRTVEEARSVRTQHLLVVQEPQTGAGSAVGRSLIPVRRLNPEQPLHEEVVALLRRVLAARAMSTVGHDGQVEVLFRLNERVDDLIARRRIDVRVELADDEHQVALQVLRVNRVRRRLIVRTERPSHPLLVPPDLVDPVVVTAGVGVGDFIELWMEDEAAHRVLSAGRRSIETDTRNVVPWVLRGDSLVPENAIGEARVAEVSPGDVVERLRAVARSHAVDLHQHEPELGHRLQ